MREILGPARLRLHGGNVADEFGRRFGPAARAKVLAGEVFRADGSVIDATAELPAGSFGSRTPRGGRSCACAPLR